MLAQNVNSPLASSCGRLFDAVAAAIGLAREQTCYEGQGAMELEAIIDYLAIDAMSDESAYPFFIAVGESDGIPNVDPSDMWFALLRDLKSGTDTGLIAARFHKGLAIGVTKMVETLVEGQREAGQKIGTVVLSGGCFQNRALLEQVTERITAIGLIVLSHSRVPANDGGLALGQIAIAAARHIAAHSATGGR